LNDFYYSTAIKFNTALVGIMSAISLVAHAGKVNLSGRGGVKEIAIIVDINLEMHTFL